MRRPATAARRYAEAAFQIATRDGTVSEWADRLELAGALVADERMARIIDSPSIPYEERNGLMREALAWPEEDAALNLVRLLLRRGRASLLPRLSHEFRRLVNRSAGVVEATVASAVPLEEADVAALRARLEGMTGAHVRLAASIDPSLIGGLVVRVGDTMIDSSVRGRLERLREQLAASSR